LLDSPRLSVWLKIGDTLELRFGNGEGERERIDCDDAESAVACCSRAKQDIVVPAQGKARSVVYAPLMASNAVQGVLAISSPRAHGEHERQVARSLAAYGAVALANAANAEALAEAKAELANEKMRHVLVHAGKMVAVGRLASGVVHEMSHPVGAIALLAGNAGALLANGRGTEAADMLGQISDDVRRLKNLIGRLRDFARADPPRLSRCDLAQVVSDARQLFGPRLKMETVDYREALDSVGVNVDAERLALVIANLVINAADAVMESSRKIIEVASTVADGQVLLTVRDSGPGLSDSVKERLFEPFFTTKPEGQGLGLGLALSAESLASIGGRLEADNDNGPLGGARFTVMLPLAQ
jgi:C4-dicarboxylate-specific signal transduction histidine kinase